MGSPKELAAVQDNAAICAKPHVLDRLLRLIAQLLVLLLWKSVQAIGVPVKKFLALNLWCGRSASKLSLWVHHQLVKGVGWSMAPAFPHNSRVERLSRNSLRFGDPRRVHVGLGARLLTPAAAA